MRAESLAKYSQKPHWAGRAVGFALALHRKTSEEAHPPAGKCYRKGSTGQMPLFLSG